MKRAINAKLFDLFSQLPDTADGVAEMFRREGIKGVQRSSMRCPVANWLRRIAREFDDDAWVSVGPNSFFIAVDEKAGNIILADGALLPVLSNFIRDFDKWDAYPDLAEV